MEVSQVMNPFLRVSLVSDSKSEQTKVSLVQRNATDLEFQEEFVFDDVSQNDLKTNVSPLAKSSLEICILFNVP